MRFQNTRPHGCPWSAVVDRSWSQGCFPLEVNIVNPRSFIRKGKLKNSPGIWQQGLVGTVRNTHQFSYEIPYLRRDPDEGNLEWAALLLVSCSAPLAQYHPAWTPALKKTLTQEWEICRTAPWRVEQEEANTMTNLQEPGGLAPSFKLPLGWAHCHSSLSINTS